MASSITNPGKATASKDFLTPKEGMEKGSEHQGFVVTDVIPIDELSGCAYVMRHKSTGARLMWLSCADNNKSFSIAFKTPPADDTGTFHILEHSVLCGSDRFPVKEPFVNLLKTSMQTFLNALTFADKTMYPVASTNTADLENLMDVYLDAVLHPAIYQRRRIFEQEGWHLELEGPDAPLTYNGVVFNEMKGALSNPDEVLFHGLDKALFPTTAYRFESGGDPRAIPTLTYEKFLDNHARHYNLKNSYTILYGDLDISRELAFIGKRFDEATVRDAGEPNPLTLQPAIRAPFSQVKMATTPDNASVGLAYVIGTAADRERVLAADILMDAIAGSNEAPLKRAIMDAGLGDDVSSILYDGELQPRVVLQLKGAKPGVAQRFRELVENTCAQLASKGIERERLEASIAQAEFNLLEGDWGMNADGVALSIQAMSSWLYDDNRPVDYLRYEDAIAHLREGVSKGYFEELLRSLVCQSKHCAEVELVPVEEGSAAEEAAELQHMKSSMTPDQLQAVMDEAEALHAEQAAPDDPADLAKLPQLGVSDIEPAKPEPAMQDVDAPLPCWYHDLDTHHIDYVYHYFDLRRVGFEELPYVGVLSELLGELDTRDHTAAQLDTQVERYLGNLDFFCETYSYNDDPSDYRPFFVVSASALSHNVEKLASLPAEVWSSTNFYSNKDRVRDILQQRRIALEQGFVGSGHSAAASRAATYFSESARVTDALGGVGYYQFLKRLLADFDDNVRYLADRLTDLARRIFTSDEVLTSFTGSRDDLQRYWDAAGNLGLAPLCANASAKKSLPLDAASAGEVATGNESQVAHHLHVTLPQLKNEGFVIPSNVGYVVLNGPRPSHDTASNGVWNVGSRAIAFYLWNEVRVKGGAYGVGYRHGTTGMQTYWSYRDPNLDATLERYEGTPDWLAQWHGDPGELDGYIVSTVASHDAPVKPRQLARRQDGMRLCGRDASWRDELRAQELACTEQDIRDLAKPLSDLAGTHGVCVFGPKELIESSKLDLTTVTLMENE